TDETKPRLLGKLEAILGLVLHLGERISGREEVCIDVVAAERCKSEVAYLVRSLESATQQITARPNMLRPRHNKISEGHVRSGLKALQSALFDQCTPEPTEAKPALVVAKAQSGDHPKHT